jgi:hypothetical protein
LPTINLLIKEHFVKRITTELVDDLDGGIITAGQGGTVSFGLDGKQYEIDLTSANADRLRSALFPFIAKARSAGGSRSRGSASGASGRSRATSSASGETQRIREWAQANGYPVGDRGRIAAEIREAYANK